MFSFEHTRTVGRKGGIAAGQKMTPEARSDRATKAGNKTLSLYGKEYYVILGSAGAKKLEEARCHSNLS